MKIIFLSELKDKVTIVYTKQHFNELDHSGKVYKKADVLKKPDCFKDTEIIFSTWGMPHFTEAEIETFFPKLKAVFYAAGSVQSFAREFINRGVKVFSCWDVNAIPVAEYTLAQILLAAKGFYRLSALASGGFTAEAKALKNNYMGNYNITVGIIGAGMIGKKVIKLLKSFDINILVYDAFLSEDEIKALGAKKVCLIELFKSCDVISNHLADKEETKGILDYELFKKMRPYATFINTGRGAQVKEDDLALALLKRKDLTAVLDVTYPEPPKENHRFFTLNNCFLTPHIAGSMGREVKRMGDKAVSMCKDFMAGKDLQCEITAKILETMA